MWETQIVTMGDGTLFVECGPMRMFIEASQDGTPRPDMCRKAAYEALAFLEQVAGDRHHLQGPARSMERPELGPLARKMWQAALVVDAPDLTPMAAVAGTISDATADFLEAHGMTRVVVNNGGDLALRLKGDAKVSVGIRPDVQGDRVSHRVLVTARTGVRGVCTSGLGGRSFTRGVASAATVFSRDAAVADAAATALGNATYIQAESVVRVRADAVFPDTDLKGVEVTASVGDLSDEQIEEALQQGVSKAEALIASRAILGACLFVKGRMLATSGLEALMESLES